MKEVSGIILHQTNSSQPFSTLIAYNWRTVGAHFLISPAGIIYQTARINQMCYHVGIIRSRCMETYRCSKIETIDNAVDRASLSSPEAMSRIHNREAQKPAAARYPTNQDSIGIEVVGTTENGIYKLPSREQQFWSRWLVNQLLDTVRVHRSRVYSHGAIGAQKNYSEGGRIAY